jgi:DNA gyrase/topoisomerase IV subunit A
LELLKILDEIKERKIQIEYLTKIINDPKELDKVIIDELIYIKEEY